LLTADSEAAIRAGHDGADCFQSNIFPAIGCHAADKLFQLRGSGGGVRHSSVHRIEWDNLVIHGPLPSLIVEVFYLAIFDSISSQPENPEVAVPAARLTGSLATAVMPARNMEKLAA
jgi:hypothetical protein